MVNEARECGLEVVVIGRDPARLPAGPLPRVASIAEPRALQQAFVGCAMVIDCAGPFLTSKACESVCFSYEERWSFLFKTG